MTKFYFKAIFLFFLTFIIRNTAVLAQTANQSSTITGAVTDENSKPVPFATITLMRSPDSSVVKGSLTDESGIYRMEHVGGGDYFIRVSNIGHTTIFSSPFSVTGSLSLIERPVLQLIASKRELSGVSVTATRALIERKSDRTVMNVANSVLSAGNTALEILARAPGVTIDQNENISLKGKQGVTVMLNDKLTYLSSSQLANLLRSTDGSTIQSIEIITNPSAKYDAAGNSGIINIKLKKNRQSGTNGSLTTGVAYGRNWNDNTNLNLNHKQGQFNLFGTFSHRDTRRYHDLSIDRAVQDNSGVFTYFNQSATLPHTNHDNSYRLGGDYEVNNRNTLGIQLNGYFNNELDNNNSRTNIGSSPGQVTSYQTTTSRIPQTYRDFAVNLYDRLKIDSNGQELGIDLDYARFDNNSAAQYRTDFFLPDGSVQSPTVFLRNQTPSVITIHAAKLDYNYPVSKDIKLESGLKFSEVKTDNDLQAQKLADSTYINDPSLTNRFRYTEQIAAAYLNLNKSFEKTTIQLGLRAEYTHSDGELLTQGQEVNRRYLDFFPDAFVTHHLNDKSEIGLTYGKRIDRPGYADLNPFVYYVDSYTYLKGNSFLNPQYTNNFEFNYTYDRLISVSLGYSQTSNVITQVLLTDPATAATTQTNENLQQFRNYSLNLNAPFTLAKWWSANLNATVFYSRYQADTLLGSKLNHAKAAYQGQLSQTFQVGHIFKAELLTSYQSSFIYGIYLLKYHFSNDAGISHTFSDKRSNLKFSVSDLFNTRRDDVTSFYQTNHIDIRQKSETRLARLTFTYNFGGNVIKASEHQGASGDLTNRVKGAN